MNLYNLMHSDATRHLIDYWLSAHSCVRARHVEVRAAEAARLAQVVIRAFDQQKAWPAEPRHIFARAVLISHESCALAIKASSELPRVIAADICRASQFRRLT